MLDFPGVCITYTPGFSLEKKKKRKKTKQQNPEREVQEGGDVCIPTADSC